MGREWNGPRPLAWTACAKPTPSTTSSCAATATVTVRRLRIPLPRRHRRRRPRHPRSPLRLGRQGVVGARDRRHRPLRAPTRRPPPVSSPRARRPRLARGGPSAAGSAASRRQARRRRVFASTRVAGPAARGVGGASSARRPAVPWLPFDADVARYAARAPRRPARPAAIRCAPGCGSSSTPARRPVARRNRPAPRPPPAVNWDPDPLDTFRALPGADRAPRAPDRSIRARTARGRLADPSPSPSADATRRLRGSGSSTTRRSRTSAARAPRRADARDAGTARR